MTGTPDLRPAGAYLHGLTSPVVVVTARVADWLLTHTDLDRLRMEHRGADPEVDAQLIALTRAALAWRTSAPASACGSSLALPAEVPAVSEAMSTGQTAKALGITSRAVRLAITEGRLAATQHDGRWLVTPDALERFRARRAA